MAAIKSQKLKELVRARGKKDGVDGLAAVSIQTGISVSTLQKMMAGRYRHAQTFEKMRDLADALNVPMEELFEIKTVGAVKKRKAG